MKELRGTTNKRANLLADDRGVITLDFIFALALAFGFSVLFFAMSFTLSMVEVCQYITYSAARTYYGANVSKQAQEDLGKAKYAELKGKGLFKTIFKTGWVTLGDISFDDYSLSEPYNDSLAGANAIFEGAHVPFKANVLNLRLPFLGNTATNTTTGSATLNAYLMREVSTDECQNNFTRNRLSKLKELDSRYQSLQGAEVFITDNGC